MIRSEFGFVCDHQLKQVLKKIVNDDQLDKYYIKMLNLEKTQDALINFFKETCEEFSISDDQCSSYCFIVKHISDKILVKSCKIEKYQTESEIQLQIKNDNIKKEEEQEMLTTELDQLYKSYEKTKEERDKILKEFKQNESNWSKIPHNIDKKKFRLYSDLLYVIEDLQRSINKI